AGADGITVHLREDRRHIVDRDLDVLKATIQTRLNLEMAATEEMLSIAEALKHEHCCLVPERPEEITTEGGLDVLANYDVLKAATERLQAASIQESIFIDTQPQQIEAAAHVSADA